MSTTATAPAAAGAAPEAEAKSGKKKLIIIVVLVLLLGGGGGYWFFLKPAGAEPAPEPGEVLVLDPVQINLAEGHYLRIGIALQLVVDIKHEPDGSKALDATIELFSGQDMVDLGKAKHRQQLKEELLVYLEEEYHGDVMGVYFTEFVTQ